METGSIPAFAMWLAKITGVSTLNMAKHIGYKSVESMRTSFYIRGSMPYVKCLLLPSLFGMTVDEFNEAYRRYCDLIDYVTGYKIMDDK